MVTFSPEISVVIDRLNFRYPFRIAHGMRIGTDVVLIKLHVDGHFGLGEATLPPYLPWSAGDVAQLIESAAITFALKDSQPTWQVADPRLFECPPAVAAIDMAIWQCAASLVGKTVGDCIGLVPHRIPHTFTIGICDLDEMRDKVQFGLSHGFTHFKLKMDGQNDRRIIDNYHQVTAHPFAIDANQAWKEGAYTTAFAKELEQSGCLLLEQPFFKTNHQAHRDLSDQLRIPVIADESIQGMADLLAFGNHYTGINIKLQKCGGITPALAMIEKAKALNHHILIGCMSESSIGCGAGEWVANGAHMADLDGPWLISNDQEIMERALAL